MKKLILFDFDGVLFNSKKNMELSWLEVKKKFSLTANFSEYFKFIGMPFKKILSKLKIKASSYDKIEKFYQLNSIKYINKIKPYPGVLKNLKKKKLKNYYLGVWTSKHRYRVNKILKKYNLKFDIILTPSKKYRGKPFPDQVTTCLKRLKISNNNTFFVGDMNIDKIAAKNAKIKFILARYGFGRFDLKNDLSVNNFKEVFRIIK